MLLCQLAALTLAVACAEPDAATDTDTASDVASPDADRADANADADADDNHNHTPLPHWTPPDGGYKVIFIDIGQGDASLLIAPGGETLLIDGGKSPKLLAFRLHELGVPRIDAIVATHADADHIGGLLAAFDDYVVKRVYWNGGDKSTGVFKDFMAATEAEGAEVVVGRRGDTHALGTLTLEFIHPASLSGDYNDDSLVVMTGCAGAWVLFTGDAGIDAEADMAKGGVLSDIDVLKVSHHGSKSGTSQLLLDAITPAQAVISAGLKNGYGHPDAVVVDRLKQAGAKVWLTDTTIGDDSVQMTANCKGTYEVGPVWP